MCVFSVYLHYFFLLSFAIFHNQCSKPRGPNTQLHIVNDTGCPTTLPVPDMTYNVFGGTLSLTQSVLLLCLQHLMVAVTDNRLLLRKFLCFSAMTKLLVSFSAQLAELIV